MQLITCLLEVVGMNKSTKLMLKKNNSRDKEISDENLETYINMIAYLRVSDLTEYNQEVVREDIIELILDGQQRGDNIEKVMGGNYKEICDEIIDAMPRKTKKEKVLDFIAISLNPLWILGIIAVINNLIEGLSGGKSKLTFIFSVGNIISTIIIIILSNMIVWYFCKNSFHEKQTRKKILYLKLWALFSVLIAIAVLAVIYLDFVILDIPLIIAVIVVLLIFIVSKIVNSRVS